MNNKTTDQPLGLIKIINFGFCLIIIFSVFSISLFSSSPGVEQGKVLKSLLSVIFPLALFSVVGLWFSLPLYIKKNFDGTEISGFKAAIWSYLLSFMLLVSMLVFLMLNASIRGSGFTDEDVFYGLLSIVFLPNAAIFMVSQIVRCFSALLIHKIEIVFGVILLLLGSLAAFELIHLMTHFH